VPKGDDERIDINLDAEPASDASLESVLQEAAAVVSGKAEPMPEGEAEAADALREQLGALQAQVDDLTATMKRRQADFENYKKRLDRERSQDAARAVAPLVESVLPVLDAFERALSVHGDAAIEEYRKGFELIYRHLLESLSKIGLERIAAEGKRFDPNQHQAIERVESPDHEDDTVLAELQHGYRLRDRVLRPTFVRVSVRPGPSAGDTPAGGGAPPTDEPEMVN